MRLLIDTHTFIWMDSAPEKLPRQVTELLQNPKHNLLLSVVSVWEIQIKTQLGKLDLHSELAKLVQEQQKRNRLVILPITLAHVLALGKLPLHHKDPFDRLLIAQAINESATLLSRDKVFANYPVKLLWS